MKHLEKYKVFENSGSGNAQFDWLRKQNNERFFKLADILTSEVFDDFWVSEKKTERFSDEEPHPTHRFWAFNTQTLRLNAEKVCVLKSSDEISETDEIKAIYVYNIRESERENFYAEVFRIRERVFAYCGKHLVVSEESYVDSEIVFDYVITLGDDSKFYRIE